ncbi:MAG: glycerol-3-phosphate acyltransferase [Clostridia bacterium]|nr:glycerol-3-phosphate acyltransferase [Clostridia bacterium]
MQLHFVDLWWPFLLLAIGSYMIGNVNFALFISILKNRDIRKEGSGNPGTMNMTRTFGLKTGILTFVLDVLKGAVPALVARIVFRDMYFAGTTLEVGVTAQFIAGFFAVLGHIFPIILNFKGGKGIATTIGVFLVAEPVVTLIFIAIAFAYILITAMGSMGSFIATTPSAIAALIDLYILGFEKEPTVAYGTAFFVVTMLLILGIILLTWHAHRQNIKRLLAGEEHETGWLDMIYDLKLKKLKKKALKKEQNNKDK